jgi:hypothetical protein
LNDDGTLIRIFVCYPAGDDYRLQENSPIDAAQPYPDGSGYLVQWTNPKKGNYDGMA